MNTAYSRFAVEIDTINEKATEDPKKNNTVKAIQNDLLDLLPIKLRKIFIPWCLENTVYCTTYREKDM